MNIIRARQEERRRKVSEILNTIQKAFSEGKSLDRKNLIFEICYNQAISQRTATEYLSIALSQVNHKIDLVAGVVTIFPSKDVPLLPEF